MQIYMLGIGGADATSAHVELELPYSPNGAFKTAQIGDLVVGVLLVVIEPAGGLDINDASNFFKSLVVTESSSQPGVPVLVQVSQNLAFSTKKLLVLLQRGTDIPATITVGPVDLRT